MRESRASRGLDRLPRRGSGPDRAVVRRRLLPTLRGRGLRIPSDRRQGLHLNLALGPAVSPGARALRSDQLGERGVNLREACLQLGGADEVGPRPLELTAEATLVEPKHELLAGPLVELVPIGPGAELRP